MTISAKIIADSLSPSGVRLTTLQLRYPRVIHSEFMTHRVFSRNASSSRAVPVERLIQDVLDDPYVPIHWGRNQKGMQADVENFELVDGKPVWAPVALKRLGAEQVYGQPADAWLDLRDRAVEGARAYAAAGYHKQIVNRLLEPFAHINVVVTATEWTNFFVLRDHPDAMPEIAELARTIRQAMAASTPARVEMGEWHLPYVNPREDMPEISGAINDAQWQALTKLSVARCARVSYLTQDGKKPLVAADLQLYDRLVGSTPLHASPAEHQATPDDKRGSEWLRRPLHGNFRGWVQFRKTLPGEFQ
jgi:hypothetical protein